jgi:sirohydrochlorin cobaltochelatase
MRDLTTHLASWLENGGREAGEVAIAAAGDGAFELRHRDDLGREDLAAHEGPEAAREIANFDDAGKFRPLKTAPNLRHGWRLRIANPGELRRALDYFYPAMLGVWCSHEHGGLTPVPLRETLARQTGMYRITQKLTDEQAQALAGELCRSGGGCLKHILWRIAPDLPIRTLPAEKLAAPPAATSLPLLCHEACNLLVAQARVVVKKAADQP